MPSMRLLPLLTSLLLAWPATGRAHDTWFSVVPEARAGGLRLVLGTGNRFPQREFGVDAGLLDGQGCRHADRPAVAMTVGASGPQGLSLRARPAQGARRGQPASITCWAQLKPLEIRIEAALVAVYLDEIAAPAAVREAWREMHARGVPWQERYRKHARVEHRDPRLGGGDAPPARPVPMAMDIVLDSGLDGLHAGQQVAFRVLRHGQPLAGQAIELRSDRSPIGLWVRTDGQGRAALRVPFAGSWLLRGTDLRLSSERPDAWDSRFVTLAFEVAPARR